jgi:hypothetical protein
MGITDIEDSFKRLNNLIEEEVRMAIAQTLRATIERQSGAQPVLPITHLTLNHCPHRCQASQRGYGYRQCCGKYR